MSKHKVQDILIPSTKGNLLATIHYPKEVSHKLIILCQGFLDSKDYRHMVRLAEMFTEYGYTAVRFNPTGVWGSEGDISDYTLTQCIRDIKNIKTCIQNTHHYSHVMLCGHSMGGTASMLFASANTGVSSVLGIMTSGKLPLTKESIFFWEKRWYITLKRRDPRDGTPRKFKIPFSVFKDQKKYDVISECSRIMCPVFLFSGEFDTIVPPCDVLAFYKSLKNTVEKTYVRIDGVTHDYGLTQHETDKVNSVIANVLRIYYTR